jgi:hypothetical protein
MILALCIEFMLLWSLVVVCGYYPQYGCSVKNSHLKPSVVLKSFVRYGIYPTFKYASDHIWVLGKNNFDSLMPVGCFRYRWEENCCNYVLRPTEAVQLWQ